MRTVDARQYDWEELGGGGLLALLAFVKGAEKVSLENANDATKVTRSGRKRCEYPLFSQYGTYLQYGEVDEAVLFKNGRILVCCTTGEFRSSFASHDNIRVRYYGLTPRNGEE